MRLATHKTPLQRVGFQCLFEANPEDVSLNQAPQYNPGGVSVFNWRGFNDEAPFADQQVAVCQPVWSPDELTWGKAMGSVGFDGQESHLILRRLYAPTGPHYFLMVINVTGKSGFILDAAGRVIIPAADIPPGWGIVEVVSESVEPINGTVVMGCAQDTQTDFAEFEIALFGYRQGIPSSDEREAMCNQIEDALKVEERYEISNVRQYTGGELKASRDRQAPGLSRLDQAGRESLHTGASDAKGDDSDPG